MEKSCDKYMKSPVHNLENELEIIKSILDLGQTQCKTHQDLRQLKELFVAYGPVSGFRLSYYACIGLLMLK